MKKTLITSIFAALPLFTWAVVVPTSNVVSNDPGILGPYALDGAGGTVDATTLPSTTGYLFYTTGNPYSVDFSNITLTNFDTTGGPGSGGGAGLGGALFAGTGVTLNLSNVNLIGNNVTGGTGGFSKIGGVLNNVFVATSDGIAGHNGTDAYFFSGYYSSGNGAAGKNGAPGGNAINGFGGNGGNGGNGSDGTPTSAQQVIAIAQSSLDLAKIAGEVVINVVKTALAAADFAGVAAAIVAGEVNLEFIYAPIEGFVDALFSAQNILQVIEDSDTTAFDVAKAAAEVAYAVALQVSAYELSGTSGNGGAGGAGNIGGNGSYGFGGGAGGNGGNGGNAVVDSVAKGGQGGLNAPGGNGGFGGGGGKGGDSGANGINGAFKFSVNGDLVNTSGDPGLGGFGAGNGSTGSFLFGGPLEGVGGQGGSGFGGAIFLQSGAALNITGPATFCGNFAQGGSSLNGGSAGAALGTDLFMMTGSTVTLNPGLGNTISFGGTISDDSATSFANLSQGAGFGNGLTVASGLVIFNGKNTYSGPTVITGGVLQASDGTGINPASNINLSGGIFQGAGTVNRDLGTQANRLQFAPGIASGFSAAEEDLTVTLSCGQTLTWGGSFFLSSGVPFLFGSSSATNNVTFTNPIDLAGVNQTILSTPGPSGTNRAILTGALSDGSLTLGDVSHTGIIELAGANTYTGPTQVSGGTVILSGSLQSTSLTINAGTTFIDQNSGLANGTAAVVNGTFILDANDTINNLTGSGTIELNGGTLTINSGNFSGPITSTDSTDGIIKASVLGLTLSGASTYTGPTQIIGGTLTLTGSLQSQTIIIGPGAFIDDLSGGLSSTSAVTVNGELDLGAAQTIGSLFGTGIVALNAGSITVGSGEFAGTISGVNPAFGLIKNTTGTLILEGVNTFVGPTLVNAGTLTLNILGQIGNGPVTIASGATLNDLNGGLVTTVAIQVDGTLNIGADQTLGTLTGASTGLINLNNGSLTVDSGNYAGVIAGTNPLFSLTKTTAGTLILSGNSTYVGPTNINVGTLTLTGTLASPTVNVATGAIFNDNSGGLSSTATLTNNGTVNLPVDNTILALINTGTINGVGTLTATTYALENGSIINANLGLGTITSTGTVQLNGTSSASPINIVNGTFTTGPLGTRLLLFPDVTINSTAALVLQGNESIGGLFDGVPTGGSVVLNGNTLSVNDGSFSGVISGTSTSELIKSSSGTLTLGGANTYTGSTFVDAGTLLLTGSLQSPFVSIASGATMEDVNGGLLSPTLVLDVNGTFLLDNNQTIPTLVGSMTGVVTMNGGNLTINNGSFAGAITAISPLLSLTKTTNGILTLSGLSTYTGPTNVNAGTMILNGGLASLNVGVALGATLDDNGGPAGGLAAGSTLNNNGIVNLGADDTILTLNNTGILNGTATLTATNYNLNGGSVINANLGAGTLNSNGVVQLNGTSSATPVNVISGSLTLGAPGARLLLAPEVSVNTGANLVLTGNESIDGLTDGTSGGGTVSLQSYQLTLNDGVFSGAITGNPLSSLIKNSGGTLVLSGNNTYLGSTLVNAGTVTLTGTMQSEFLAVAAGATFNDVSGGLSGLTVLVNNGAFVLSANDTIASVVNSGTISGTGFTLTAATYLLQNGSNVSANLGTGVLTTTGNVTLSGTSAAGTVNISPASTLNLVGNQRLSSTATVNVNGTLSAPTFDQTIGVLNGTGGNVIANNFQVNNGGTYSGQINVASFTAGGGTLNLNNTTLNAPIFTLDSSSTVNFAGAGGLATTSAITLNNNSTLVVSGGAVVKNSGDTNIDPNALLSVITGSQYLNAGNINLDPNAMMNVDASSLITAIQINTGIGSTITVPNSASLSYTVLTGFGTINTLGNTFVNLATVSGDLIFSDGFTNMGTFKPGFSPGLMIIGGNYTEGNILDLEIDNTTAISGYSQVRVGGTATLLPSSQFDVTINAGALVPGNFFQVIANSAGGPIPVGGVLGSLIVTVNGSPSAPASLIFDAATGQLLVTGIGPIPPGPPGPPVPNPKPPPNPFFHLGCTTNQNRASKAIFSQALMGTEQINTTTVAGQLAKAILQSDHCKALALFVPKFYGALSDYAMLGDRALASRVWDTVTVFSSLPEQCCPKLSAFTGYLTADAQHLHGSNLQRHEKYVGVDFSNCKGFSVGAAATISQGKIRAHLGRSNVEGNAGLFYLRKNLGAYFMAYGILSGSYQDNHMKRPTLFGHSRATTTTKSYTANLGVRYNGYSSKYFSIAPRANVVYSHAIVKGFAEKGEIDALHDSGYKARFLTCELGFSSVLHFNLFHRPMDIEATAGVEQPFMYLKKAMHMYVLEDPSIDYLVVLAETAKTRINGGANIGYNIFKRVTIFAGYEVISGGNWNHTGTAGVRICL